MLHTLQCIYVYTSVDAECIIIWWGHFYIQNTNVHEIKGRNDKGLYIYFFFLCMYIYCIYVQWRPRVCCTSVKRVGKCTLYMEEYIEKYIQKKSLYSLLFIYFLFFYFNLPHESHGNHDDHYFLFFYILPDKSRSISQFSIRHYCSKDQ